MLCDPLRGSGRSKEMEDERITYWNKLEISSEKSPEDAYVDYCTELATSLDGDLYPWTRY